MESTSLACELSLEIEKSQIAVAYNFKISRSFASVVIFPVLQSFFLTAWTIATNFFFQFCHDKCDEKRLGSLPKTYSRVQDLFLFSSVFPHSQGLQTTLLLERMTHMTAQLRSRNSIKIVTSSSGFGFPIKRNGSERQMDLCIYHYFKIDISLCPMEPIFFPFYELSIALFHIFILWASLKWWAFNAFQYHS